MSKPALGKGLGALIPKGKPAGGPPDGGGGGGVLEVELSRITPNEFQPRKSFNDEALGELAASIKSKGVIQPVVVRKKPGGGYELIMGERRYRASRLAGMTKIPAVIKEAATSEMLELALIENIQREDLNPVETAEAYERLMAGSGLTQQQVADKVGKDRSSVANFLRLLSLPPDIKKDIAAGAISMGHAKALLMLDSANRQMTLRREIITRGLSVREAEALARKMKPSGETGISGGRKKRGGQSAQVALLEDELKAALGSKVRIRPKGKGGKIEIEYYSNEELDRLLEVLRG